MLGCGLLGWGARTLGGWPLGLYTAGAVLILFAVAQQIEAAIRGEP